MRRFRTAALLMAMAGLLSACIVVNRAPPPSGQVWVPGHYNAAGVWVPGHWR
ncbi:MAG TPA: hypothetical protein VD970_17455 [Acetobacteraceae bacterium]|nr:hypothetical protein [Acetobacteraceae bacterium]